MQSAQSRLVQSVFKFDMSQTSLPVSARVCVWEMRELSRHQEIDARNLAPQAADCQLLCYAPCSGAQLLQSFALPGNLVIVQADVAPLVKAEQQ
ncbi:MAG: hypothetical protein IT342_16510 [Candidatus Melainabacteria bacterium]|nr:hypothetical protein [Candidatus Melainabacteria bacterium]